MSKNDTACQIAVLCSIALASGACAPADKEVGSACKNGVCSAALAADAPVCLATGMTAQIEVTNDPDQDPNLKLTLICLPRQLATDDAGRVQCNVLWTLPAKPSDGAPARCSDLPFLRPSTDPTTCVLDQVAANAADASSEDGWFYDEMPNKQCSGVGLSAIHFTDAARPPTGVLVSLSCATVQEVAADGKLSPSDGAMCRLRPDSAAHAKAVGDTCMPKAVPESGFSESEDYVQTGATECATGVCLVFHLSGDPRPGCEEADAGDTSACNARRLGDGAHPECDPIKRCADPNDVKDRVYCSCRCNAPGSADECKCPGGFVCIDALPDGPEALRGGYCVHEGT